MNNEITDIEVREIDSPETEVGMITTFADANFIKSIKAAANNANEVENAITKMLLAITRPGDWIRMGDKACLSSAGAERFIKHLPIRFRNVKWKKEAIDDELGKGYRYIYSGEARLGEKTVYAEGRYGSRDKFLGFKNGEWRQIEDINENHIQNAALHIFRGNCIKCLLGLRGLEWSDIEPILQQMGKDTNKATTVTHTKGGQGGTQATDKDRQLQADIYKWLDEMYQSDMDAIKSALAEYTKFKGKDGNEVSQDSLKKLTGKWLQKTHHKVKEAYAEYIKLVGE